MSQRSLEMSNPFAWSPGPVDSAVQTYATIDPKWQRQRNEQWSALLASLDDCNALGVKMKDARISGSGNNGQPV